MSVWRQVTRGIRMLGNRRAADQEIAEEVNHYLEESTAMFAARGLTPDEARRAARMEIGNETAVREQIREYGWENTIDTWFADLRYAVRRLGGKPGFTLKTPFEICSMRRAMPKPCIGSRLSVLRISISSVPWMRSVFGSFIGAPAETCVPE